MGKGIATPGAGYHREVVIKFDIRSVGIFDVVSARLADGEVFDSAKLKNTVRFLIENDMRNVVIDLGNLEYLYSDTINAFIASNRHMLEVSGRIAILTEHPKVQDILKRAGLDNIMRIYRSEAEMIADSKEILRQTSSYRIEELQKISTQTDAPQIPKTEFDEFKAEMGQRLGSKLDNNEVPQYQLGVTPAAAAAAPTQAPRNPETAYPAFNPPGFGSTRAPEAPTTGIPPGKQPAYNFNNQAFGGMANTTPTFPDAASQNYNQAPPNFDFPTVQLPVGQFGNLNQPIASHSPQAATGPTTPPPDDIDTTDLSDPRDRKSSQERMRSPNARKQKGRRAGGREIPGGDEEKAQVVPAYAENRTEPAAREEKAVAYGGLPPVHATNLVEEARFPAKLIIFLLLIGLGVGLYFYLSNQRELQAESPAAETPTQQPVTEPELVAPSPTQPEVPATTPTTPSAVTPPPLVQSPKVPASETQKPTASKPAKVATQKTPRKERERNEKPVPTPPPAEEAAPAPTAQGLFITSNPSGAEVLINFSKKGNTPLSVILNSNSNKIIVRMPGYKRFETTLPKNHPNKELIVDLDKEESSEPAPKAVVKAPEPERPRVEAKAEPKVEPKVEEPEDLPKSQPAVKERERDLEPVAKAKPADITPGDGPIGIIFLSSSPARADIYVDGKNTGKKTPAKLELPSGQHRIEMSKSGQKATVDQMVNEGKNKALHLTLQ